MPRFSSPLSFALGSIAALFLAPAVADDTLPINSTQPGSVDIQSRQVTQNPTTAEPQDESVPADTVRPSIATDADLWARVRSGFKMQEVDTPAVKAQERFYASKPEFMRRVVERSRRYLYFIVSEVERRGMPTEIALLPIVESAFVPKAQSPASASGLWQFIPSTGKRYGLERTWWYDGRQDVTAATYAALDYLQDLYNLFGDWQLALAAYNWGEGGVGRALSKTRARGLDDSFETIKKPRETENYVPKLMAIRNIIADPAAFGLQLPSVPNKPYFQAVSTGRHIDVQLAAKLAGTTVEELLHLNPGLIRPVFAAKDDRKLLLPADKADAFEQNLQGYDKPLLSWQPYVTKSGEAIANIADKFGIAAAELRDVNKLGNERVARGQTILVPIRPEIDVADRQNLASLMAGAAASTKAAEQPDEVRKIEHKSLSHTVARGETLVSIAKHYRLSADELRKLNGLRSNKVAVGSSLKIRLAQSEEAAPAKTGKLAAIKKPAKPKQYVVKRGDTLDEIAKRYDVSVTDLKKWNRPAGKGMLKAGFKLEIRDNG